MFGFFKRSKSQKSKNHSTTESNAQLVKEPITNFLNGACANIVLGVQNIDAATRDYEENLKKDEHATRLKLTSIQHDITSDGNSNVLPNNRSENFESNSSYNSKSPSLIRSIMAKGRNKRKYVHTNSGNKNNNSNKNTSKNQNGKVKSQNSVELYEQLKVEQAEQKIHDENFHNIDNYSDDHDFDDVKQSANENRYTENGENSSTNTDATAENSFVESAASIVNDLVYTKYNTVSPIYIKPVNSVCENASDDQCLTKIKMGQETSKNSAVKNMENNSNNNNNNVQQQDEEVFYEAKDINPPEIEYKASLLLNVNVDENINGQFENCDEHKCDSAFDDSEFIDSDGAGVLCDSVIGEKEQEKEESLKKSLSLKEDSISLPDVVESRCIIVSDQPDLDAITKTSKIEAVDKLNQEMKDLVNQEQRYSARLEEVESKAKEAESKGIELQSKIEELEREVSVKSCSVERLEAELESAQREDKAVRDRLKIQEAEIGNLRTKLDTSQEELKLKFQNLQIEFDENAMKHAQLQEYTRSLNLQLLDANRLVEELKKEKEKLVDERIEEQKIVKEALEIALKERAQLEAKWKHDFEQLRTLNSDREEHLMEDCEWKLRSMQKICKEKLELAEREKKNANEKLTHLEKESKQQSEEVKKFKSYETEVEKLRGLTAEQKASITSMTRQIDQLKSEMKDVNSKLQEEIYNVQQIKRQCEFQLNEKERDALNRIEIARGEIAMQWEDRLLREMNRLKTELEQIHLEERQTAVDKIKEQALRDTEELQKNFSDKEKQLNEEIESLKVLLERKRSEFEKYQTETDAKLLQSRRFIDKAERDHEIKMDKEVLRRESMLNDLKEQHDKEKYEMEQNFSIRLQHIQDEFAKELLVATEALKEKHQKDLEEQWKQLITEKEDALQTMETRSRLRLEEADTKIRELTATHQTQIKELHDEQLLERTAFDKRDMINSQEIQTLHKKCRCLTNLFEEIRMRYERRDPRPEDLEQIDELKSIIDSQDRDLRVLTERLREIQLHEEYLMQQQQFQQQPHPAPRRNKNRGGKNSREPDLQLQLELQQQTNTVVPPQSPILKSPPLKLECDVIYEENEEESQDTKENEESVTDDKLQIHSVPEIVTVPNELNLAEQIMDEIVQNVEKWSAENLTKNPPDVPKTSSNVPDVVADAVQEVTC